MKTCYHLFLLSADKYFCLIQLQGFQLCSFILQVCLIVCGVIISTSSLFNHYFCECILKSFSLILQSSWYLMMSSNFLNGNFSCVFSLDTPVAGWNLLFKISHAHKMLPFVKSSVANSSTICQHNVPSWEKFVLSFLGYKNCPQR